ncbi:MAG: adenosylmethionine--8-amino-7-oxononanoate transaminase [Puniceicoccales bacterium]|jgi:adenosylmethionine-8-amino-7-oxononanoate aminotransferase|nr:adenosylmethionine--8-amino-7-oxononanoate transaminase [Puniceicoccales bacterium]
MIWRPFTQEKIDPPAVRIVRGEGAYLFSENGEKYLDMISSWFVNIHGHAHREIAEAIGLQAKTLEHVIFTRFSHEPAERLVDNLKKVVPPQLSRYFFSDNGSTAVEVALKMAYQYFKNIGAEAENRNIFLSLEGGYHGDTFGVMSAAGQYSKYHATFSELFFKTVRIDVPEYYDGAESMEEKENEIICKLEKTLQDIGEKICAFILEPLLQGSFGMRLYRVEFLERLVNKVREYGILVIFDEVMTGFYRTGKMFAMNYTDILPDLICLSKGITGGFLPLALTIATDKIYESFLSDDRKKTFLHGHSYTANPIACAAACKSLEILQREETVAKIKGIAEFHRNHDIFNAIKRRRIGIITAFDVESEDKARFIINKAWENGIFLRPLGKTIYLFPPYCVSDDDLSRTYDVINKYL